MLGGAIHRAVGDTSVGQPVRLASHSRTGNIETLRWICHHGEHTDKARPWEIHTLKRLAQGEETTDYK